MKVALATLLLAAAGVVAQNTSYQPDPQWKPPERAAERANPIADKPELAAGGRKVFERNCAVCHGKQGEGLRKAADLQLPAVQEQSDGTLFWKISNGNSRRGMPGFSGLPEMQRWQIVLYLRTIGKPGPAPHN